MTHLNISSVANKRPLFQIKMISTLFANNVYYECCSNPFIVSHNTIGINCWLFGKPKCE
jgi:hypothetical protein